ncbi:hypothetical protein ACUWEX_09290 [Okibacterium fritillariae]|uniref:hypothetical protein n=1 Tax=Okibacterium fritillariae TaxID=123320 RepID=UPI00405539B3
MSLGSRFLVRHSATIHVLNNAEAWDDRLRLTWREDLANALTDGGVLAVWGEEAEHAVWMLFAEMIRNTLEHGSGSGIFITTNHNTAEVFIQDEEFGFEQLRSQSRPGGGAKSLEAFAHDLGERFEVNAEVHDGGIYIRVCARAYASPFDPCSVQLEHEELNDAQLDELEGCSTVHVYAPERLMLSDGWVVPNAVQEVFKLGARVVVHHRRVQGALVQDEVRRQFQDKMDLVAFAEIE